MYFEASRIQSSVSERLQPLGVESNLGFGRIEQLENLRPVGFGVALDVLPRHRGTGDVAASGIADQARHVADQEDDGVAQILEMLQLADQNSVAEMEVGRGRDRIRLLHEGGGFPLPKR